MLIFSYKDLSLKKWDCIFAPYPEGKWHRLILIGKLDNILLFFTVQSEVKNSKLSYIEIPKHLWENELKNSFSFVVCEKSSIVKIDFEQFKYDYDENNIKIKEIPAIIIDDIKKAIKNSKTFNEYEINSILDGFDSNDN